jgi:hypothetical protein
MHNGYIKRRRRKENNRRDIWRNNDYEFLPNQCLEFPTGLETQRTLVGINAKDEQTAPRHIIFKIQKIKVKKEFEECQKGMESTLSKKQQQCQALVAHACNPSYLRSRHQENRSLGPTQANSLWDPISKILTRKKGRMTERMNSTMIYCKNFCVTMYSIIIIMLKTKEQQKNKGWHSMSACLASVRSWVQTPVLPKKSNSRNYIHLLKNHASMKKVKWNI